MIDIAFLRAKTDLVALIQRTVKLTKRGKDWYGSCPFHAGDRSPSFSVVPAKGFWHCHGCGEHGDALDFVMRTEHLTLPEAAARLGGADASPETKRRLAQERQDRERIGLEVKRRQTIIDDFLDRNPASVAADLRICNTCRYPLACDCWQ
jgi:DNA primase